MLHKMTTHSQIADNAAARFKGLEDLFPAGVAATVMRGPGDPHLLYPEEAACLGRAVPKRVQEFAAGRLCARLALESFGIGDFPLRVAADRQPIWPRGIVGSISHTAGLCIAAVCLKSRYDALGVDCEVVGHVTEELWATICTSREADWLGGLPVAERAVAAALIFSAKESFYKCQYPLTGEWLDFHDLECESPRWGAQRAEFTLSETRPLKFRHTHPEPVCGSYLLHDGFVTTGVVVGPATADLESSGGGQ